MAKTIEHYKQGNTSLHSLMGEINIFIYHTHFCPMCRPLPTSNEEVLDGSLLLVHMHTDPSAQR
jgi:hypothetical protein